MITNIINCLEIINIKKDDKDKWVKYYNLETKKYYDYLLNLIPKNQNILEIGSGGGMFYEENLLKLIKLNNKYTCIDIDKNAIENCKSNDKIKLVKFLHKDIHSYKGKELGKFDILILHLRTLKTPIFLQTYICKKIFKNIFVWVYRVNGNIKQD